MVGKVIRDYMEGGSSGAKKLAVPGFGTFMRKEGGEVIFVDLLRKDDGVLRELVEDYGSYSEVEAMAVIDRFIFETKNAIERHGSTSIEGFGTMTLDAKGSYRFDYVPKAQPRHEKAVQESLFDESGGVGLKPGEGGVARAHPSALTDGQKGHNQPKGFSPTKTTPPPTPPKRKKSKPSRADIFMIIAIAAAIIAILAMVFGLSTTGNSPLPFLNR